MDVSARLIRHKRHLIGYRRRKTVKKPYLSPANRLERYRWCLAHQNCKFNFHVFADESMRRSLEIPLYHSRLPCSNPCAIGKENNIKAKVNIHTSISRRGCSGIVVSKLFFFFINLLFLL